MIFFNNHTDLKIMNIKKFKKIFFFFKDINKPQFMIGKLFFTSIFI